MTTSPTSPSLRRFSLPEEIAAAVIMLLALAVGAYVRLQAVMPHSFPLNDGGLFYVMSQDIVNNHFALPAFSSYNAIHMPFAYPPLGFYLAALLNTTFKWSMLDIVWQLPMVINILTIPAFYLLARTILKSPMQAAFAVFAFALLPRSFKWLIMGGGLTRSLGFLFAMFALQQAYLLYSTRSRHYLIPTILLSALTALSHPEMALYTAASIFLFFLFYWRTREGLITSLIAGVGVLVVTAPYWLTVIGYHGLAPLLAAFQTGEYVTYPNVAILIFTGLAFSEQAFFGIVGVFGLIKCIAESRWLLPLWVLVLYIVDPRAAPTYVTIPLALAVAIFIDEVVLSNIIRGSATALRTTGRRIALALLVSFMVSYGYIFAGSVSFPVLSIEQRQAMDWVAANTPTDAQFAIVTGNPIWAQDMESEWFPVLAQRVSLATVQGFEWFPNQKFFERRTRFETLQQCAGKDVECLKVWATDSTVSLDYIYLSGGVATDSPLHIALAASGDFKLIYEAPGVKIYERSGT